ncbi:MAG: divergent polysaccharide deacetylase family protein [Candidatus Omnitrophica bacterium]|nr:divergent polysaccharide deacetylase family protein [Candidatus Omnitrophota bacterium]MCM8788790.1 divergent polysaccharide deacetylase family protein [Candidatus Omnitrophota bacterium]
MNRKYVSKNGAGILILFLVFLILLTLLFLVQEGKKRETVIETHKPVKKKFFAKTEEKLIQQPFFKETKPGGKIALIIDDVGWNPDISTWIKKINVPLTLAILPDSPFGLKIAQQVSNDENIEVILHIPLEPENAGDETRISKTYLTIAMSNEQIAEKFDEYMKKFAPYVCGVNNHMGSKFTTNREKMGALLQKIKEKKLVYIDSLTTNKSIGYTLARQMGIPAGKRDIFLDNPADYPDIFITLETAAKMAARKGMVIAIGHARTTTLKAIENKIPELIRQGYQFIPITQATQ